MECLVAPLADDVDGDQQFNNEDRRWSRSSINRRGASGTGSCWRHGDFRLGADSGSCSWQPDTTMVPTILHRVMPSGE